MVVRLPLIRTANKVQNAFDNGTLRKVVAGVDKVTGNFVMVPSD